MCFVPDPRRTTVSRPAPRSWEVNDLHGFPYKAPPTYITYPTVPRLYAKTYQNAILVFIITSYRLQSFACCCYVLAYSKLSEIYLAVRLSYSWQEMALAFVLVAFPIANRRHTTRTTVNAVAVRLITWHGEHFIGSGMRFDVDDCPWDY